MFGLMHRSGPRSPSAAIRRALESDGLPPGMDVATALGVVEAHSRYAGRKVTLIRVFERARAAARGLNVNAFEDLDRDRNLVLRTGHIEQDGTVIITWRPPSSEAETPLREQADRTIHADDERFVFSSDYRSRLGGAP